MFGPGILRILDKLLNEAALRPIAPQQISPSAELYWYTSSNHQSVWVGGHVVYTTISSELVEGNFTELRERPFPNPPVFGSGHFSGRPKIIGGITAALTNVIHGDASEVDLQVRFSSPANLSTIDLNDLQIRDTSGGSITPATASLSPDKLTATYQVILADASITNFVFLRPNQVRSLRTQAWHFAQSGQIGVILPQHRNQTLAPPITGRTAYPGKWRFTF